ncbi:chaplin [Streptomyces sp. NPDC018964]|uniref:chaplin n=1 Tax=unclassified Streptomyces TaxID=2593676 RepID=UPI0037A78CE7
MRQTLSRGVFVAAAAATGILSLYGTPALADSYAVGAAEDSPGVLSGNNVQAPVHGPVNKCGNSVNVAGAFNEAADNTCVNGSSASGHGKHGDSAGGAYAVGGAKGSPGVLSGNNVQAPVQGPVNVCGNSADVVGAGNWTAGNTCVNGSHGHAEKSTDSTKEESAYGDPSHGDSSYGDSGGAYAVGGAEWSPGVLSGNNVQTSVDAPVNVCGNSADVYGLFNGAYGNDCANEGGYDEDGPGKDGPGKEEPPGGEDEPGKEDQPGKEDEPGKETPPPPTQVKTPPTHEAEKPPAEEEQPPGNLPHLALTGTEGMIAASAAGAVLITGGAMLYRRSRLASRS